MNEELKVSDPVELISGSKKMVIGKIVDGIATCYREGSEPIEYPITVLKLWKFDSGISFGSNNNRNNY